MLVEQQFGASHEEARKATASCHDAITRRDGSLSEADRNRLIAAYSTNSTLIDALALRELEAM